MAVLRRPVWTPPHEHGREAPICLGQDWIPALRRPAALARGATAEPCGAASGTVSRVVVYPRPEVPQPEAQPFAALPADWPRSGVRYPAVICHLRSQRETGRTPSNIASASSGNGCGRSFAAPKHAGAPLGAILWRW